MTTKDEMGIVEAHSIAKKLERHYEAFQKLREALEVAISLEKRVIPKLNTKKAALEKDIEKLEGDKVGAERRAAQAMQDATDKLRAHERQRQLETAELNRQRKAAQMALKEFLATKEKQQADAETKHKASVKAMTAEREELSKEVKRLRSELGKIKEHVASF